MADFEIKTALQVRCPLGEFIWASKFFQEEYDNQIFHVSTWDFYHDVTDFSMQDEPEFAQNLVREIFKRLQGTQKPDEIIFI